MKVHIVLSHVDHIDREIIGVYASPEGAEALCRACAEYDKLSPPHPLYPSTEEANKQWALARTAWNEGHPAGVNNYSGSSTYTVQEHELCG